MSRVHPLVSGRRATSPAGRLLSAFYRIEARRRLGVPLMDVALSDWTVEQFRDHVRSRAPRHRADPVAYLVRAGKGLPTTTLEGVVWVETSGAMDTRTYHGP